MSESNKDKSSRTYRLHAAADGAPVRKAVLVDAVAAVSSAAGLRGRASSGERADMSVGRKKLGNFAPLKPKDAREGSEAQDDGAVASTGERPQSPSGCNVLGKMDEPRGRQQAEGPQHPEAADASDVSDASREAASVRSAEPRANRMAAQGERSFGWVEGGLPVPASGGCYAVEFLGDDQVRVLAYIDPFGRAFGTDEPVMVPPARYPDLEFRQDEDTKGRQRARGSVLVRDAGGAQGGEGLTDVARYSCLDDVYELFDTWYAFSGRNRDLGYNDAMARTFFAFVYRPSLGATPVPARGLGGIFDSLRSTDFVSSLLAMVAHVNDAMRDPSLSVPGLVQCLVRWLDEAAGGSLRSLGLSDGDLRLVRTIRYADTFFVGNETEGDKLPASRVWAIEAALNRFLLASERLGEKAGIASVEEAELADAQVIAQAASQAPVIGPLAGSPKYLDGRDFPDSEWRFRCRFAAALERMRVPFRVPVAFRSDVEAGVVALDVTLPGAEVLGCCGASEGEALRGEGSAETNPAAADEDDGAGEGAFEAEGAVALAESGTGDGTAGSADAGGPQLDAASLYGLRMGLFVAAAAFRASDTVTKVHLYLHALDDEQVGDGPMRSMGFMPAGDDFDALFLNQQELGERSVVADVHSEQGVAVVALDRAVFEATDGFKQARAGDPLPLYRENDAMLSRFALQGIGPFDAVRSLPSAAARKDLPEVAREPLGAEAAKALGAPNSFDLRIVYDGELRRFAEDLAESIVDATTVAQAIGQVRAVQEHESQRRSEPTVSACTRLMAALAEGSVSLGDPNAMVNVCLGEDRCRVANLRADALSEQGRFDEAASLLIDAIRESAALDGFIDGSTTVFRSFDTYASRLLYNLAREGTVTGIDAVEADGDRRVELTTDSFFMAHADVTRMLERSFEYSDQAVSYGKRLIELSPTVTLGYRVLGRAYMLTGDMESARKTLVAGLKVALVAGDISALYYQLAYVLWKMGKPEVGAACYAKCLEVSPVVAMQAQAELDELLQEASLPAPDPGRIGRTLRQGGVPVAPRPCLLNEIDKAVVAAVQENLFPVARGLLAVRLRYRPDDALSNVLRSLSD